MKLQVTYHNAKTGEHEEYVTTLAELVQTFNGMMDQEAVRNRVAESGIAIINNGYTVTTITIPDGLPFYISKRGGE